MKNLLLTRYRCTMSYALPIRHYLSIFILVFTFMLITKEGVSQITVTSSTTWTSPPVGIGSGVIISGSNVKLTIAGSSDFYFNAGAKIVVNSSCTLEIINTTLRSMTTWDGIIADGDHTIDQYTTLPNHNSPFTNTKWEGVLVGNQTKVILTSCTLRNARIGVESTDGAIVRMKSCDVYNCERGVYLGEYTASNSLSGAPQLNASYMIDTRFHWDDFFKSLFAPDDNDYNEIIGVYLDNVGAPNIGGCVFENLIYNSNASLDARGTGIYANESELSLDKGGNVFCLDDENLGTNCVTQCGLGDRSVFRLLGTGIEFNGTHVATKVESVKIRYTDFEHCNSSAIIRNALHAIVANSTFKDEVVEINARGLSVDNLSLPIVQLVLQDCQIVHVFVNSFWADMRADPGIVMLRLSDPVELPNTPPLPWRIQKCNFQHDQSIIPQVCSENLTAIEVAGRHKNTEIACNTFTDVPFDIHIVGGANPAGLNAQGSSTFGLCNMFTDLGSTKFDNFQCYFNILREDAINTALYYFAYIGTGCSGTEPYVSDATVNYFKQAGTSTSGMRDCETKTCNKLLSENDFPLEPTYQLFPNPANTEFNVRIPHMNMPVSVTILDTKGTLVYKIELQPGESLVKIPDELANGVYFISLSSDLHYEVKKLVLNR